MVKIPDPPEGFKLCGAGKLFFRTVMFLWHIFK